VLPHNSTVLVDSLCKALKLSPDECFELAPHDGKHVFPTPCSVRNLVTKYTDITGPLRRADLKQLAAYATDPMDQQVLLRLASKEGKAEYIDKIETPQVRSEWGGCQAEVHARQEFNSSEWRPKRAQIRGAQCTSVAT